MSDVHSIKHNEAAEYGGYVLRGPSGPEKTALLQQRCKCLLEKASAGEGMLIFAGDRSTLLEWDRELRHIYPVEPRLCTFQGFVRQELEVFYPLVAAKCGGLARTEVRPAFLDRDAAVSMIAKVIQYRREKEGIFASLSSTGERIASDILGSLEVAAMAGIPYDQTFERLYASLEIKNEDRRKIYRDAGEIACAYRSKCLELGVLDMAESIELYCGYLLKDGGYAASLKRNIKYLAADEVQFWDEAQLSLAELLLPGLRGFAFGFDPEAPGGGTNRLRRNKLLEDRLLARCSAAESVATQEAAAGGLPDALHDAIVSGRTGRPQMGAAGKAPAVERHPAAELRSEMLELLGERICGLIEAEGVKPSDITILSTYADIVTELVLADVLRSRGYGLTNLAARDTASDSRLCRALLAFAALGHPQLKIYPSRDDVRLLLERLFSLDPPGASLLAGKVCGGIPFMALPGPDWPGLAEILDEGRLKKYRYVLDWIEEYKNTTEAGPEFFLQKALLEIFLKLAESESEINKAKRLVDRAGDFCRMVSRFDRNAGRDFLSSAGYRTSLGAGFRHAAEESGETDVILATPAAYLQAGYMSRVTVICGLSSKNWSPARIRELVNPDVLSGAWKEGKTYTAAHEEADRRLYLADIMRAVMRNCGERLITFESLLSANGYENDGMLPEIFDAIL